MIAVLKKRSVRVAFMVPVFVIGLPLLIYVVFPELVTTGHAAIIAWAVMISLVLAIVAFTSFVIWLIKHIEVTTIEVEERKSASKKL